jgi:hypothetical protein
MSDQRVLQRIEIRVLEQMWIGGARRVVGGALAVAVAAAAPAWWLQATAHQSLRVAIALPAVTAALFMLAAASSVVALFVRSFRWCYIAAYCCGLAAAIGIGAFWWVRTGNAAIGVTWLVLADVATVILCVGWLALILTPIERSQPDMRNCIR